MKDRGNREARTSPFDGNAARAQHTLTLLPILASLCPSPGPCSSFALDGTRQWQRSARWESSVLVTNFKEPAACSCCYRSHLTLRRRIRDGKRPTKRNDAGLKERIPAGTITVEKIPRRMRHRQGRWGASRACGWALQKKRGLRGQEKEREWATLDQILV